MLSVGLRGFAAQEAGQLADRSAGVTHEKPADRRDRIHDAEAQIAGEPDRRQIGGKEAVERIR